MSSASPSLSIAESSRSSKMLSLILARAIPNVAGDIRFAAEASKSVFNLLINGVALDDIVPC